MFRAGATRLCAAGAAATATNANEIAAEAAKKHTYYKEWAAARADKDSVLAGESYSFLQSQVDAYRELQAQYAVKQTDVERARKAAAMCGLEMTGSYRGPRKGPTDAEGNPMPSFSDQVREKKERGLKTVLEQALEAERAGQSPPDQ
uniref:Uncharacterized protein n=1 Tax=Neobodo designis TaxID=312471 RepID=A0A7S1W230_NEODS